MSDAYEPPAASGAGGSGPDDTAYHLSPAVSVLAFGGRALLLGAAVLVGVVLGALRRHGEVLEVLFWVVVAIGLVLAVAMLSGAWRLIRRPEVLRLDADGYSVHAIRGAGVRSAPWTAVERAESAEHDGQQGVDLLLRDGRRTTLATRLIAEPSAVWIADLDRRLNAAYGLRRLSG